MTAVTSSPIRRCRPTEDFVIQPHSWQAYGYYSANGNSAFATAVRASNAFMAHDAVLSQVHPFGPVVTSLRRIDPMPRPVRS